jgi:class 3 adenylate cyclase
MAESRKLAAILASDVVGFSRMAEADEALTLARLRTLRSDLVDPTISAHNGRVVKRTGDGLLVEFRSVIDAIRCAIEVQNAMVDRNAGVSDDRRIVFRMGVHLGEVVEEADGDLMGNGVNIAARLEGIAEPGTVYLSQPVFEQIRGKLAYEVVDLGERELKNIVHPVRIYAVRPGYPSLPSVPSRPAPSGNAPGSNMPILVGLVAATLGTFLWLFLPQLKSAVIGHTAAPIASRPDAPSQADLGNQPSSQTADQRTFVTVPPNVMMNFYRDNMNLRADKLFSDFSGKWMRLSGKVGNLRSTISGQDTVLVFDDGNLQEQLYMFFESGWRDRLSTLVKDQVVNVECQIYQADRYSVTFEHCRMN